MSAKEKKPAIMLYLHALYTTVNWLNVRDVHWCYKLICFIKWHSKHVSMSFRFILNIKNMHKLLFQKKNECTRQTTLDNMNEKTLTFDLYWASLSNYLTK